MIQTIVTSCFVPENAPTDSNPRHYIRMLQNDMTYSEPLLADGLTVNDEELLLSRIPNISFDALVALFPEKYDIDL